MIKMPPQLPGPDKQWIEPRTGKPTPAAYQYFRELDRIIRELVTSSNEMDIRVTELELP